MNNKTTEQLFKEEEQRFFDRFFDAYEDNKIEAILERWEAALSSFEQSLKCPESMTCLNTAESAIKYSRLLIEKIEFKEKGCPCKEELELRKLKRFCEETICCIKCDSRCANPCGIPDFTDNETMENVDCEYLRKK